MEYDNFVFYGSWRESLEGFREEFGDDYAKEALWNLMLVATAGDIETERKSIIGFINGAVMPNVNKAKDRYAAAIENGKKGGRPKVNLNEQEVLEKKKELGTWKETAQYFGVTEQSLKNYRNQWENEKNPKNPKNPNTAVVENPKNPKNLDIDIDIDIEKEKEKEKEIEKDIFSFSWFDEEEEEERKRKIVESAKQVRSVAIRKNPNSRFRDEEEQEYFDFIKGANIEKGMSETAAEADAWQMILDDREYWDSKVKIS